MSRKTTLILLILATAFLCALLVYFVGLNLPSPEELTIWLRGLGAWGPFAIIGLMILHSFIPFPAEILAICAGAVYGTLVGSALVWAGAMLGGLLAFYLSRLLGRDVVHAWLSPSQANTLDRWAQDQGTFTLLISRFIPVISFNLVNYAAGLTGVRVWTFVWTSAVGILPMTVMSTYLGSQMKTMDWPILLIVSTTGIFVVILGHSFAKSRKWI
ncbi:MULTISPECIES: TVP38/TMEM64 family protein [Falsihalocynthiibacter]|uniref:TVP38/TMEM64 family protein n=1 Tax=Falsihalocynthiibacter TaxID=2854182 RepID=UPI0030010118